MITALTLTYAEEAIGIARAAQKRGLPVVDRRSRSRPTGGCPAGQSLGEAIAQVDAETGGAAAYFMVNCAHPTHFAGVLRRRPWVERLGGLRANALDA